MSIRNLMVCCVLSLAGGTATTQAQEENPVVPGADWVGVGVDLLGIHLDDDGYPVTHDAGRRHHWIIKGIEQGDEATTYADHQIGPATFRVPKVLIAKPDKQEHIRTYASTNTHELHTKTTTEYSLEATYEAFSGNFSSKTSKTSDHSETRYYAWSNSVKRTHILIIRDVDLKEHLSERFKQQLNDSKFTPDKLFRKYGTHLVKEVAIGSRKEMYSTKFNTEDITETEYESSIQAGFTGIASGTKKEFGDAKEKKAFEESSKNEDSFGDDESPAVIGFLKNDEALLGIWELCGKPERRAELEEAYNLRAALKAITTPVLFTNGPGNISKDAANPELVLTVPHGYKILSGGARATPGGSSGFLICDSYPKDIRTWNARGKTAKLPAGQLTISVVAIHDPDGHWQVKEIRRVGKALNNELFMLAEPTPEEMQSHTWVGGGVRMESENWNDDPYHFLFQSMPHDNAYPVTTDMDARAWTTKLIRHYDARIGEPMSYDGWIAASAMPHGATRGHLTGFVLGVRARSTHAKRLSLEAKMFVERSNHQAHEPFVQLSPPVVDGPSFTLVGGGAVAVGRYQYLSESFPAQGGASRLEWHARSVNIHVKDVQYIYGMAIGLRARLSQ